LGGGGANAVKQVTLIGGGIRNYGYDASGNMTADDNLGNQFAAKYDHANLATKLQRGAVINYFTYGPNNAKARQTGTDGSKVYLGGYEDWITAGQTKLSLGNYAQITNGTGGRVLHYFLTDRLGSVDAVTDGNGNLIETRGYDAFGAPRTGVWGDASQIASTAITPKGFTSHEHLNSVKLIHMNGRMYDFQLGRFLGVDPFIQAPTNSQSMNPYSYIMNNPLGGTDPTGYLIGCIVTVLCDAITPPKEEKVSSSNQRFDMHVNHQGGPNLRPSVGRNGAKKQSPTQNSGSQPINVSSQTSNTSSASNSSNITTWADTSTYRPLSAEFDTLAYATNSQNNLKFIRDMTTLVDYYKSEGLTVLSDLDALAKKEGFTIFFTAINPLTKKLEHEMGMYNYAHLKNKMLIISLNTRAGLKLPGALDGVQSPALGLFHELHHAINFLRDPTNNYAQITKDEASNVAYNKADDAAIITGPESVLAKKWKQTARRFHSEGTPIQVKCPTCIK